MPGDQQDYRGGDATPLIDDFAADQSAGLCLLVIGEGFATTHALPREGEVILGRASDADVTIDVVGVSRRHALLRIGSAIEIEDLDSANGTYVNDMRLVPETPAGVALGDPIELGAITVIVQQSRAAVRPRRIWTHGYFEARLEEECARGRRSGTCFTLVRLRVQPLSMVDSANSTSLIISALREEDTLAAYGPNDFELLITDLAPGPRLEEVIQNMHRQLLAHGAKVKIGVSSFPHDGRSSEDLMAKACDGVIERKPQARANKDSVIIESGVMKRLHRLVERIAAGTINVLLLGETGVGKEIFADRVHRLSPRAGKKMMRVNCAAFNESLVESELFGHVKGAFTGAVQDKAGLFEACDGGSLFFDEIGDLPLPLQAKLLRVLEDRRVRRVGSMEDRPVDVRIIAATHRDLEAEVLLNTFRQDLFFRLNGVSIQIPPLRERQDEIAPLARMFLDRSCEEQNLGASPAISSAAMDLLNSYSWPGNLRELRNVMERAALLALDGVVTEEHIPVEKMRSQAVHRMAPTPHPSAAVPDGGLRNDLDARERSIIIAALDKAGGNQSQAARDLGISRGTLIDRIKTYGLPRPRKKSKS